MTHKEAADILDPVTSREALRPYDYDQKRKLQVIDDACRVAAEMLRGAADINAGDKWESAKDNPPKESGEYIVGCNGLKVKQMSKIMSISPCFDCWLRYSSYCMTCEWWEVGIGLRED